MVQRRLWRNLGILTGCHSGSSTLHPTAGERATTTFCDFPFWLWQTEACRWVSKLLISTFKYFYHTYVQLKLIVKCLLTPKLPKPTMPTIYFLLLRKWCQFTRPDLSRGFTFPESPMPIPSPHMWGDADEHIPSWTSKVLAERFDNPQVHAHAGPLLPSN